MFKTIFKKSNIASAITFSLLLGTGLVFGQSIITNPGLTEDQVIALINANVPDSVSKTVNLMVKDDSESCATGDGAGDVFFNFPSDLDGTVYNLTGIILTSQTAGTTGTMDVQLRNVTQGADMLTTKVTVDSAEKTSLTAATPAVIDTNNDDVNKGDEIRVDIDACHSTPSLGVEAILYFDPA